MQFACINEIVDEVYFDLFEFSEVLFDECVDILESTPQQRVQLVFYAIVSSLITFNPTFPELGEQIGPIYCHLGCGDGSAGLIPPSSILICLLILLSGYGIFTGIVYRFGVKYEIHQPSLMKYGSIAAVLYPQASVSRFGLT